MKTWKLDPTHSEIKFKVKHLVVSTVTGQFGTFSAQLETNNSDFVEASVTFEADVNSIHTGIEKRDGHLKSPDFFDAENFPKISFISKSFKKNSGSEYSLIGDITIRGITKEIKLDVNYAGTVKGFGGSYDVAVFEVSGKLRRLDFGLQWNGLTETGGVVVSDEVKLEIFAEFLEG